MQCSFPRNKILPAKPSKKYCDIDIRGNKSGRRLLPKAVIDASLNLIKEVCESAGRPRLGVIYR